MSRKDGEKVPVGKSGGDGFVHYNHGHLRWVTPQHLRAKACLAKALNLRKTFNSVLQPAHHHCLNHFRLISWQLLMCTKMEKPGCSCATTVSC